MTEPDWILRAAAECARLAVHFDDSDRGDYLREVTIEAVAMRERLHARAEAAETRWEALREWLDAMDDGDWAHMSMNELNDKLDAFEEAEADPPHVTPEAEARLAEFKRLAVERVASADELLERVRRELESDDE